MTNKITFFQFKTSDPSYQISEEFKKTQKLKKLPRLQNALENVEYDIKNLDKDNSFRMEEFNERKEQLMKDIHDLKEETSDIGEFERISIDDLNDLNEKIEIMNEKGWSIKQIQSIQSGGHQYSHYSFTEGMMIVWEK